MNPQLLGVVALLNANHNQTREIQDQLDYADHADQFEEVEEDILALFFASVEQRNQVTVERLVDLHPQLIDAPNKGLTPLFTAAKGGDDEMIETLVRLGSKAIDTPDADGWTPIHVAAKKGHVSVIETLVRLGSNAIDTPNKFGFTPMHAAAQRGSLLMIEMLVRLEATLSMHLMNPAK